MSSIHVLKFGSSVLRSRADTAVAIHDIYAQYRAGNPVVAIVSAYAGATDRLLEEGNRLGFREHALANHVAAGERESALALTEALWESGIPARAIEPAAIGLCAAGPSLEATPIDLDTSAIRQALVEAPVLVVPGFIAIDEVRRTVLLGRGGSDLSALFLAQRLGARCRLVKDVDGVYDHDPADRSAPAHRYERLSWRKALEVGGELVQPRAIRFAESRGYEFEVGCCSTESATHIGSGPDVLAPPVERRASLRVILLGLGTVGGGVYLHLARHPHLFDVRRVVVRDPRRPRDVHVPRELLSTDPRCAIHEPADLVIEAMGGVTPAADIIRAALLNGRTVVTANKAAVASHWSDLGRFVGGGPAPHLLFSAAAGGAVPVLETLGRLNPGARRVRAVINGTCNFILDALENGRAFDAAVREAQAAGFAEADPSQDLSGIDAAHKLQLIAHAAFGTSTGIAVDVCGIDGISADRVRESARSGRKWRLVAECERRSEHGRDHIVGRVRLEELSQSDFLAGARGEENRVEIHAAPGITHLSGKGAGRWPTAAAVMGDVFAYSRERARLAHLAPGERMRVSGLR